MKSLIILIWLFWSSSEELKFILINDILYKMPDSEITKFKKANNILEKDITTFKFSDDSCFAPLVEWIEVTSFKAQLNDPYKNYRVPTTPLYVCEGKFIGIEYIKPEDILSIGIIPKDESVSRYGCKGLNPIFLIKLQSGRTIQSKPTGRLKITQEKLPIQLISKESDHFTIIGKTTRFKDSTKLYLNDRKSGSAFINLDSTYIINNSFSFKGAVSEPLYLTIHTGWKKQTTPENFNALTFIVSNSTIYIDDESGLLKFAKTSGSNLQDEDNKLREMRNPIITAFDSINKALRLLTPADSSKRKFLNKEFQRETEAYEQLIFDFIKTHPKSFISASSLNAYKTTWGREETRDLFNSLDQQNQNTKDGKSIEEYLKIQFTVDFRTAKDIELQNLRGELIKLSSLKGKYVLLDFWAAYCGPCRAEHPRLLNLYNQYKEKGFEIYAVSLDEKKENWQKAVRDDKITWITVSDLKGSANSKAAMLYEVTGIPKNFLIDKTGKIIAEDLRGEELENKLKEIFKYK